MFAKIVINALIKLVAHPRCRSEFISTSTGVATMIISKPKIATPVPLTIFVAASLSTPLSYSKTKDEKTHKCHKFAIGCRERG